MTFQHIHSCYVFTGFTFHKKCHKKFSLIPKFANFWLKNVQYSEHSEDWTRFSVVHIVLNYKHLPAHLATDGRSKKYCVILFCVMVVLLCTTLSGYIKLIALNCKNLIGRNLQWCKSCITKTSLAKIHVASPKKYLRSVNTRSLKTHRCVQSHVGNRAQHFFSGLWTRTLMASILISTTQLSSAVRGQKPQHLETVIKTHEPCQRMLTCWLPRYIFYPLNMSITTNNYQTLSCYITFIILNASTGVAKGSSKNKCPVFQWPRSYCQSTLQLYSKLRPCPWGRMELGLSVRWFGKESLMDYGD